MLDMHDPQQAHVAERLHTNVIGWLTSVRPDGRPHSVPVWFLWDGKTIILFSMPKNQKLVNIRHNPNVLLALDDTKEGEDVILVEGTAEVVDQPDRDAILPGYMAKYGALMQTMGWTPEGMLARYSQTIRITPTRFPQVG
jgi:PPOX class probable F420-dependent enzyme